MSVRNIQRKRKRVRGSRTLSNRFGSGWVNPVLTKDDGKSKRPSFKNITDAMWRQYEKQFPFLKIDSYNGFFRKGDPWIDIAFSWRKSVKWKA